MQGRAHSGPDSSRKRDDLSDERRPGEEDEDPSSSHNSSMCTLQALLVPRRCTFRKVRVCTPVDPGMFKCDTGYVLDRPMQGAPNNSTFESCKGAGRMDDRKMEQCVVTYIHPMPQGELS